jgi:hypothetical protein
MFVAFRPRARREAGKSSRGHGVVTTGPYAEGILGRPLLPDGATLPILS